MPGLAAASHAAASHAAASGPAAAGPSAADAATTFRIALATTLRLAATFASPITAPSITATLTTSIFATTAGSSTYLRTVDVRKLHESRQRAGSYRHQLCQQALAWPLSS